nr:transposase [Novosphingobium flavum]
MFRSVVRGRHPPPAHQPDARFPAWCGHIDEVYVKINGAMSYLWRAVVHEDEILESIVTKK